MYKISVEHFKMVVSKTGELKSKKPVIE